MAGWMTYALLVSALLGLAGAGLEFALRAWRLPGRWAVVSGFLASALFPPLLLALPGKAGAPEAGTIRGNLRVVGETLGAHLPGGLLPALDGFLTTFWILSSLSVLILVLVIRLRLSWLVRRAPQQNFAGISFRRTRNFGPAVVGCMKSVILLPSWATSLDSRGLRMVLLHEREHLRARDPVLLFGGVLLLGLQPWNLPLWAQFLRLRRAIELDCDQRVLGGGVDLRAYADLLLSVAARRAPGFLLALPLGPRRSALARRVEGLADALSGKRVGSGGLGAVGAAGLVALALLLPTPQRTLGAAAPVGRTQALLMLALRGDSVGENDLMTLRLEGEEAARVLGSLPGAPTPGEGGRIIRRIFRSGPSEGVAPPPQDFPPAGG